MTPEEIQELIDLTGAVKMYHNDKHIYIVYEQMINGNNFVSIRDGLYKFLFDVNNLPMKISIISYDDFSKEIQDNLRDGFQVYDEDDSEITSYYVKGLITTENKYLLKYQKRFM